MQTELKSKILSNFPFCKTACREIKHIEGILFNVARAQNNQPASAEGDKSLKSELPNRKRQNK